jgi:hypothetical protein
MNPADFTKRKENLDNCVDIQCSNGNWNYDPYMWGMANGLLLAQNIMEGHARELEYKEKPKKWLKDLPTLFTRIRWKLFGAPISSAQILGAANEAIA